MNRGTDRGPTGQRLASIRPAELHEAIVRSAVTALREGAPTELADGLEFWRMSDLGARVVDIRSRRIEALASELSEAKLAYEGARRNSNAATTERMREDFFTDAEAEGHRIDELERELRRAEEESSDLVAPARFDSDCDFLAHALSALVHFGEHAPPGVAEALSQVVRFTRFTPVHSVDPPQLEIEYHLLLPADGKVAKFGPITCTVTNLAYRNTLRDNGDAQRARALLHERLGDSPDTEHDTPAGHAVQAMTERLMSQLGWSRLAGRTLATSGLQPLYAIASNLLWGDEIPADLDPTYVDLVRSTYSNPQFRWNGRHHALDCRLRQLCVDATIEEGGVIKMADLEARLEDTNVDDIRITIFSRDQQLGQAPVWRPCLERRGDWIQQHPKSGRSLAAVACPHCGRWASWVVRTPETPGCLLCPDCRRMPVTDSPTFPEVYLRL